LAPNCESELRK